MAWRIAVAALVSSLALPLRVLLAFPLVGGGWGLGPVVAGFMWLVIAGHVLLLGVPVFVLLWYARRLRGSSLVLAGFVAGMVPVGLAKWPYWRRYPGSHDERDWHGALVVLVRDGEPTLAGLLVHLEKALLVGVLGAASALVFWASWCCLQRLAGLSPYPPAEHHRE